MPVKPCMENGRPGFKYGDSGRCYTYEPGSEKARNEAKRKAHEQGYAIQKSQERRGETPG